MEDAQVRYDSKQSKHVCSTYSYLPPQVSSGYNPIRARYTVRYFDRSLKCPSRVSKMFFQGEGCIVFRIGSQGGNGAADCGNDR
jgi:hypothetical protein